MLNIEEMRDKIRDYCASRRDCDGCPLNNTPSLDCYTRVSSEVVKENYNILVNRGYIEDETLTKTQENIHLKGYIFDSLMYRYQLARERQLMYEIAKEGVEPKTARDRFYRDLMRFGQILDEAMGEHD